MSSFSFNVPKNIALNTGRPAAASTTFVLEFCFDRRLKINWTIGHICRNSNTNIREFYTRAQFQFYLPFRNLPQQTDVKYTIGQSFLMSEIKPHN